MIKPSEEPDVIGAVKSAIEGDVEAYGKVYSIYVDRIYRYVYYQVGDKMTAEDITEEVFVKTWKSIGSCRGKEGTFTAWLYRIAHNHVVDTFRKKHREVSFEDININNEDDPEQEAEDKLELHKVLEAVDSLPEQQKQVILLKFLEGVDNSEIGQILGKRQGAVRALQMRALLNLRHKITSGVRGDVG